MPRGSVGNKEEWSTAGSQTSSTEDPELESPDAASIKPGPRRWKVEQLSKIEREGGDSVDKSSQEEEQQLETVEDGSCHGASTTAATDVDELLLSGSDTEDETEGDGEGTADGGGKKQTVDNLNELDREEEEAGGYSDQNLDYDDDLVTESSNLFGSKVSSPNPERVTFSPNPERVTTSSQSSVSSGGNKYQDSLSVSSFEIEAAKSRAEIELVIQSLAKPSTDESENEGSITKEQTNDNLECDNKSEITAECDNIETALVQHEKVEQTGLLPKQEQESADKTGLNEDKTSFDAPAAPVLYTEAPITANKRMMQGKTECKICGSIVQEHRLSKHEESPHPIACTFPGCTRMFILEKTMERHLRSAHQQAAAKEIESSQPVDQADGLPTDDAHVLDPAVLDLDFTAGLEDILSSNDDSMASFVFDTTTTAAAVGASITDPTAVVENQELTEEPAGGGGGSTEAKSPPTTTFDSTAPPLETKTAKDDDSNETTEDTTAFATETSINDATKEDLKKTEEEETPIDPINGPFICKFCKEEFKNWSILTAHFITPHLFKCKFCTLCFNRQTSLEDHVNVNHDLTEGLDSTTCKFCGESFARSATLARHIQLPHDYECRKCDKKFPSLAILKKHMPLCPNKHIKLDDEEDEIQPTPNKRKASKKTSPNAGKSAKKPRKESAKTPRKKTTPLKTVGDDVNASETPDGSGIIDGSDDDTRESFEPRKRISGAKRKLSDELSDDASLMEDDQSIAGDTSVTPDIDNSDSDSSHDDVNLSVRIKKGAAGKGAKKGKQQPPAKKSKDDNDDAVSVNRSTTPVKNVVSCPKCGLEYAKTSIRKHTNREHTHACPLCVKTFLTAYQLNAHKKEHDNKDAELLNDDVPTADGGKVDEENGGKIDAAEKGADNDDGDGLDDVDPQFSSPEPDLDFGGNKILDEISEEYPGQKLSIPTEDDIERESAAHEEDAALQVDGTTCRKCRLPFSRLDEAIEHSRQPHPFDCSQCDLHFMSEPRLRYHSIMLHSVDDHIKTCCIHCGTTFAVILDYLDHLETPHKHACDQCPAKFLELMSLEQHAELKHPTQETCKYCLQVFVDDQAKYQVHVSSKHKYSCEFCSLRFVHDKHLKEHMAETHKDALAAKKERLAAEERERKRQEQAELTCGECQYLAVSRDGLAKHQLQAHNIMHGLDLKCSKCGERFPDSDRFRDHFRLAHDFPCLECENNSFPSEHSLAAHAATQHHKPDKLRCDLCKQRFEPSESAEFLSHVDLPHSYNCQSCDLTFVKGSKLKEHVAEKHQGKGEVQSKASSGSKLSESKYTCKLCGQVCTKNNDPLLSREALKKHQALPHKYPCKLCSLRFAHRPRLEAHLSSHRKSGGGSHGKGGGSTSTPDKLSAEGADRGGGECSQCGFNFYDHKAYRDHKQQLHAVPCLDMKCGRKFVSNSALEKHLARRHKDHAAAARLIHGKWQYVCKLCDTVFNKLAVHNLHAKEKHTHACHVCEAAFLEADRLLAHLQATHNLDKIPETGFFCQQCGSKFDQMKDMRLHLKQNHRFACNKCGKMFISKDECTTHCTSVHNVQQDSVHSVMREETSGDSLEKLADANKLMPNLQFLTQIRSCKDYLHRVMSGRAESYRHKLFQDPRIRDRVLRYEDTELYKSSNPMFLNLPKQFDKIIVDFMIENLNSSKNRPCEPPGWEYIFTVLIPELWIYYFCHIKKMKREDAEHRFKRRTDIKAVKSEWEDFDRTIRRYKISHGIKVEDQDDIQVVAEVSKGDTKSSEHLRSESNTDPRRRRKSGDIGRAISQPTPNKSASSKDDKKPDITLQTVSVPEARAMISPVAPEIRDPRRRNQARVPVTPTTPVILSSASLTPEDPRLLSREQRDPRRLPRQTSAEAMNSSSAKVADEATAKSAITTKRTTSTAPESAKADAIAHSESETVKSSESNYVHAEQNESKSDDLAEFNASKSDEKADDSVSLDSVSSVGSSPSPRPDEVKSAKADEVSDKTTEKADDSENQPKLVPDLDQQESTQAEQKVSETTTKSTTPEPSKLEQQESEDKADETESAEAEKSADEQLTGPPTGLAATLLLLRSQPEEKEASNADKDYKQVPSLSTDSDTVDTQHVSDETFSAEYNEVEKNKSDAAVPENYDATTTQNPPLMTSTDLSFLTAKLDSISDPQSFWSSIAQAKETIESLQSQGDESCGKQDAGTRDDWSNDSRENSRESSVNQRRSPSRRNIRDRRSDSRSRVDRRRRGSRSRSRSRNRRSRSRDRRSRSRSRDKRSGSRDRWNQSRNRRSRSRDRRSRSRDRRSRSRDRRSRSRSIGYRNRDGGNRRSRSRDISNRNRERDLFDGYNQNSRQSHDRDINTVGTSLKHPYHKPSPSTSKAAAIAPSRRRSEDMSVFMNQEKPADTRQDEEEISSGMPSNTPAIWDHPPPILAHPTEEGTEERQKDLPPPPLMQVFSAPPPSLITQPPPETHLESYNSDQKSQFAPSLPPARQEEFRATTSVAAAYSTPPPSARRGGGAYGGTPPIRSNHYGGAGGRSDNNTPPSAAVYGSPAKSTPGGSGSVQESVLSTPQSGTSDANHWAQYDDPIAGLQGIRRGSQPPAMEDVTDRNFDSQRGYDNNDRPADNNRDGGDRERHGGSRGRDFRGRGGDGFRGRGGGEGFRGRGGGEGFRGRGRGGWDQHHQRPQRGRGGAWGADRGHEGFRGRGGHWDREGGRGRHDQFQQGHRGGQFNRGGGHRGHHSEEGHFRGQRSRPFGGDRGMRRGGRQHY